MILMVPITGKLISYDPKTKVGEGSDDNVIRPLDFEKLLPGHSFRWDAVVYDYEHKTANVEVTFKKLVTVTEWDKTKDPPEALAWKKESDVEFYKRQADTEKALRDIFEGKTADELYEMTGEPRLEMP